jgi:hypothetical protein
MDIISPLLPSNSNNNNNTDILSKQHHHKLGREEREEILVLNLDYVTLTIRINGTKQIFTKM